MSKELKYKKKQLFIRIGHEFCIIGNKFLKQPYIYYSLATSQENLKESFTLEA